MPHTRRIKKICGTFRLLVLMQGWMGSFVKEFDTHRRKAQGRRGGFHMFANGGQASEPLWP